MRVCVYVCVRVCVCVHVYTCIFIYFLYVCVCACVCVHSGRRENCVLRCMVNVCQQPTQAAANNGQSVLYGGSIHGVLVY